MPAPNRSASDISVGDLIDVGLLTIGSELRLRKGRRLGRLVAVGSFEEHDEDGAVVATHPTLHQLVNAKLKRAANAWDEAHTSDPDRGWLPLAALREAYRTAAPWDDRREEQARRRILATWPRHIAEDVTSLSRSDHARLLQRALPHLASLCFSVYRAEHWDQTDPRVEQLLRGAHWQTSHYARLIAATLASVRTLAEHFDARPYPFPNVGRLEMVIEEIDAALDRTEDGRVDVSAAVDAAMERLDDLRTLVSSSQRTWPDVIGQVLAGYANRMKHQDEGRRLPWPGDRPGYGRVDRLALQAELELLASEPVAGSLDRLRIAELEATEGAIHEARAILLIDVAGLDVRRSVPLDELRTLPADLLEDARRHAELLTGRPQANPPLVVELDPADDHRPVRVVGPFYDVGRHVRPPGR